MDKINKLDNIFKIVKELTSLTFKKIFQGSVIFKNGEILFKNFKTGVNNSILFDARISEFGKRGKIHFNVVKIIELRKSPPKKLKVSGFIIPSTSKVVFQKLLFDNEDYKEKKIKNAEKKFKNEVIQKSLSNIFNNSKINNFFNSFSN